MTIDGKEPADVTYMTGFGNSFETEAVPGALPQGRNSPQRVAYGLYTEQVNGSAFTVPRAENRHSWLYRLRPAASHRPFKPFVGAHDLRSGPFNEVPPTPNRLRWDAPPIPDAPTDFVDGLATYGGNGDPSIGAGAALHFYAANQSMLERVFVDADGELLLIPQQGAIAVVTELGRLYVAPGEITVIPRGLRFRVELPAGPVRGYVCESYGQTFRLPDLGPIGANGLANPRDFLTPVAWYEDSDSATELVQKFHGRLWTTSVDHSPLDVVAWHGNLAPYKYDLARFNTLGTVSYDHPDPSLFTVLTSPSDLPGTANCDFVIFPPRWTVADDTFRPPWFHRNVMSEFMGLIRGTYDAKTYGFVPGGASLHNALSAHGPDRASYERAVNADLKPEKVDNTLAFMIETRWVIRPTRFAVETPLLQADYDACWFDFRKADVPRPGGG